MRKELLQDIGEKELINRLSQFMPKDQIVDDCAYIKCKSDDLLINTDALVENVHFNDDTMSSSDIGWKAVASNISDLISSGCEEVLGISISLILPPHTDWIWVENLYKGINQALIHYGGIILGGDSSVGKEKVISINAMGIQGKLKMQRNFCKPGEVILTTGFHGLSTLGLQIKNNNTFKNSVLTQDLIDRSLEQFCRPKPSMQFLNKLINTSSDKSLTRIGCTDSSDGLFQALKDLSDASNCKAIIDYEKIPKHKDWPTGSEWDKYYFFGGEDYELVFSLPRKWANNLIKSDKSITEIGYFSEGKADVEIKNLKNTELLDNKSFSHF